MTTQMHAPNVDPAFRFRVFVVCRLSVEFQAIEIRISGANGIPDFPGQDHSLEQR